MSGRTIEARLRAEQMTALLRAQIRGFGVPLPEREVRVCPERKWRFDLAWLDVRLGVEIDGGLWSAGRHGRGRGAEEDRRKIATATALGWTVLPVTPDMIKGRQIKTRILDAPAAELIAVTYKRLAEEKRIREQTRDLAGCALGLAGEYESGRRRELQRAILTDLTERARVLGLPILRVG